MLRLSNGYFFSVLRKSGIKTNGRSEGDALEEQSSDGAVGRKGGLEPAHSWFYTALKSTLVNR